ncbi:MAG: Holliday junction branch migration protein RuvA [Ilumatobacteraceae bacterium]
MIATLTGVIAEVDPSGVVIVEAAGVGYEVTMTASAAASVTIGETSRLRIHHHIREDAQTLFGFIDPAERSTFRILIATHGVGPALALAILGVHRPADLVDHVAQNNTAALTAVPGVGPKTAERLIVELRNRLSLPDIGAAGTATGVTADVRAALEQLGYSSAEVNNALAVLPSDLDASGALRAALGYLAGSDA